MWFKNALNILVNNFADKHIELLSKDIDELLNIKYFKKQNNIIFLESKLLILTYMVKLYENNDNRRTIKNGCSLFLMSPNKLIKTSTASNLYLYEGHKSKFWYKIKDRVYEMASETIASALKRELFDQPYDNPVAHSNIKTSKIILSETTKRGHTLKDDILMDLKMALIISEKVVEDMYSVWVVDFKEFGKIEELKKQERIFLCKIKFETNFDLDVFKYFIITFCDNEILQGFINEFDHNQKELPYSNTEALFPLITQLKIAPSINELRNKYFSIEKLTSDAFLSVEKKINLRISLQAKIALTIIQKGLKTVAEQRDKVALFVGGIILSLVQDDIKYYYRNKILYPQQDFKNVSGYYLSELKVDGNYFTTEHYAFLMDIGKAALTNPTLLFPKTLFTTQHKLICGNTLTCFFPAIDLCAIDKLMTFIHEEFVNTPIISDNRYSIFANTPIQQGGYRNEAPSIMPCPSDNRLLIPPN